MIAFAQYFLHMQVGFGYRHKSVSSLLHVSQHLGKPLDLKPLSYLNLFQQAAHHLQSELSAVHVLSRIFPDPEPQTLCPTQTFPSWPPITYNVNFQVGHTLEDPLERIDAYNWWLGRGSYTAYTSGYQISIWANAAALLPSPPSLPNAGPPVK